MDLIKLGIFFNRLSYIHFTFDGLICWLILNYCWDFCGLQFLNQEQQNKTACGMWKCNPESFIWQCLPHWCLGENVIHQNDDCPRESIACTVVYGTCTIVTELGMEKTHLRIMLSDTFHSSFKRLILFYTKKVQEDRTLCKKVLIESRKCFIEFHTNQLGNLHCS
jgi:hypothetical protein